MSHQGDYDSLDVRVICSRSNQQQHPGDDRRLGRLPCNAERQKGWCLLGVLPPKADMCGAVANVCFGPKADARNKVT